MGRLIITLGNRSARVFFLIGILLTVTVFIASFFTHRFENKGSAVAESEYRIALAGRLSKYGLTNEEIAGIVTAEYTPDELDKGQMILAGYGFYKGSPIGSEYAYSSFFLSELISGLGAALCLLAGMAGFCSVFRDIRKLTEQIDQDEQITYPDEHDTALLAEAAAALRKQTAHLVEQLRDEKQYLCDYLNDFSHQIKTPCTGLILNNDILSSAPMDFDEQLDYFKRDRHCLDRIQLLVGESLKLARLDAGAVEYNIEEIDLSEPVSEAVLQLKGIAAENDAEIINEVKSGTTFRCDRLWFCEAVTNLVKNAAEHTHGGTVTIRTDNDPMTIRLIIEDTGCGISEEELPKVFHRFWSRSKAVNSNSVGIGMSAAKHIVEDLGGRLLIESEVGKGTKILLEFLRTVT